MASWADGIPRATADNVAEASEPSQQDTSRRRLGVRLDGVQHFTKEAVPGRARERRLLILLDANLLLFL